MAAEATKAKGKAKAKPEAGPQEQQEPASVGRPTLYQPEFCEKVIELGNLGCSITQMARELGVSRECIYEWARNHKEFSDALTRAKDLALAFWEDEGERGLTLAGYNAGLYGRIMAARFPGDYREQKKVEVTGMDGSPLIAQSGVLVVPAAIDPEIWERAVAEQQAKLFAAPQY